MTTYRLASNSKLFIHDVKHKIEEKKIFYSYTHVYHIETFKSEFL